LNKFILIYNNIVLVMQVGFASASQVHVIH